MTAIDCALDCNICPKLPPEVLLRMARVVSDIRSRSKDADRTLSQTKADVDVVASLSSGMVDAPRTEMHFQRFALDIYQDTLAPWL